jgi:hypothetical protein
LNLAYLKSHWYYVAAGIFGLLVIYELVKNLSGASKSSASSDLSGGANQVQALSAAADLTNAQINGATTVAAYQAGTQNNAIAAELQLGEVKTAAELDAANHATDASVIINAQNVQGAITSERIVTGAQVAETQIEGNTLTTLGAQKETVNLAITNNVAKQIDNLMHYSKHFSTDVQAFAPVIAEETGQGSSAGSVKPTPQPSGTAQVISAASSGIGAILGGLFA